MSWNPLTLLGRALGKGAADAVIDGVDRAADTAGKISDTADVWIPSDQDAVRLVTLVRTTLAPGLNALLVICGICLAVWSVGPWCVGSAAYLMRIAPSPAVDPDVTPIVLLLGLITTGKGADLLSQYILDTHARRIPTPPQKPQDTPQ